MINKISEIKEFECFNNNIVITKGITKTEVFFPIGDVSNDKQISFISNENKESIFINLSPGEENNRGFRFEEIPFTNAELDDLGIKFGFKTIPHAFHPNILMGSLHSFNETYLGKCFGILHKGQSKYYLLIYASRRSVQVRSASEDFYGDNVFYIHGIWEVELSKGIEQKVFK